VHEGVAARPESSSVVCTHLHRASFTSRRGYWRPLTRHRVRRTTGIKLRGPEGAQRLRATSASMAELDSEKRAIWANGYCMERTRAHVG
jgi:hypothetical protein